ncbi:uncharacterized protein TNCV_3671321 [Trichonephila clavipes]|nr:uncharacterized protein TNCV_3671321 [Trichonephila clavipes]
MQLACRLETGLYRLYVYSQCSSPLVVPSPTAIGFEGEQGESNHDVQELWFQQDGTACHTARATIYLLKDTCGDHLISRFGPVNWPQIFSDLSPLDYFLWDYVKSLVYADKPQMLDHLEDNIRRVIADIRPQMLEKVIENWTSRLDYIRASCGSHMPEIIFKIKLSENESGGVELFCSNLYSEEGIRLPESDCEESEESSDEIDFIPVNSDINVSKDEAE